MCIGVESGGWLLAAFVDHSPLKLELIHLANPAAIRLQGASCPHLFSNRITGFHHHTWVFTWVWGFKLRPPMLIWQVLLHPAISLITLHLVSDKHGALVQHLSEPAEGFFKLQTC